MLKEAQGGVRGTYINQDADWRAINIPENSECRPATAARISDEQRCPDTSLMQRSPPGLSSSGKFVCGSRMRSRVFALPKARSSPTMPRKKERGVREPFDSSNSSRSPLRQGAPRMNWVITRSESLFPGRSPIRSACRRATLTGSSDMLGCQD